MLNLDYVREASHFQRLDHPVIDIHTHIHGEHATRIFLEACTLYGINSVYSMTQLEDTSVVRGVADSRVQFICMPSFAAKNRIAAHGLDYLARIPKFIQLGAQIVKFWNAPRIYESSNEPFATNPFRLNAKLRLDVMKHCEQLGMIFMTHIGDPDTWFQTKYVDYNRYGTKHQQYEDLEEVLSLIKRPWIGAHMLGYPEDLNFLSTLLDRYEHLYIDCSATKWIARELSRHPRQHVQSFFARWQDRILFGSDIVTSDAHLSASENTTEMHAKASSRDDAFALYASRYWVLRTLLETRYEGASPIADPDLHLVDPSRHTPLDAPTLSGFELGSDILSKIYYKNAIRLLQQSQG